MMATLLVNFMSWRSGLLLRALSPTRGLDAIRSRMRTWRKISCALAALSRYHCGMDDTEFAPAQIAAAFDLAATRGWLQVSNRCALLRGFGALADQAALDGIAEGPIRDRLFDIVMRRIDVLQAHRGGVIALLRALPFDPAAAFVLATASLASMAKLLHGAGIEAGGIKGALRTKAMLAVWLWTVRAWQSDTSEDLSATMVALDQALTRAEQAEATFASRTPIKPKEGPSHG
jgi:ubiquinone biosynthesis protein COQ9